jgi:hypothetical protein
VGGRDGIGRGGAAGGPAASGEYPAADAAVTPRPTPAAMRRARRKLGVITRRKSMPYTMNAPAVLPCTLLHLESFARSACFHNATAVHANLEGADLVMLT